MKSTSRQMNAHAMRARIHFARAAHCARVAVVAVAVSWTTSWAFGSPTRPLAADAVVVRTAAPSTVRAPAAPGPQVRDDAPTPPSHLSTPSAPALIVPRGSAAAARVHGQLPPRPIGSAFAAVPRVSRGYDAAAPPPSAPRVERR